MQMHPLARYLKKRGISQGELARKAGVGRPTITKVLSGRRRRFSPDAARRIALATENEVTLEQLLFTGRGSNDSSVAA